MQKAARDWGKGWVESQFPSTAAVPCTSVANLLPPGETPMTQLSQSLSFTEHYGVWKVNGHSMDEKTRGGLGLIMSLFWVSCLICTVGVIVLEKHSGLLWLVAAFCFPSPFPILYPKHMVIPNLVLLAQLCMVLPETLTKGIPWHVSI